MIQPYILPFSTTLIAIRPHLQQTVLSSIHAHARFCKWQVSQMSPPPFTEYLPVRPAKHTPTCRLWRLARGAFRRLATVFCGSQNQRLQGFPKISSKVLPSHYSDSCGLRRTKRMHVQLKNALVTQTCFACIFKIQNSGRFGTEFWVLVPNPKLYLTFHGPLFPVT